MSNDLISREALKEKAETVELWNGDIMRFVSYETIDNAPTVESYQDEWIPIEKEDDLIDHYWYLVAHEDYKTPIKAQYHTDVPHFTFSANGKEHASYIFEGKITHYMDLPELPKEAKNDTMHNM